MREFRRVDNERIVAELAEKRRLKDLEIRNKEKDDFGNSPTKATGEDNEWAKSSRPAMVGGGNSPAEPDRRPPRGGGDDGGFITRSNNQRQMNRQEENKEPDSGLRRGPPKEEGSGWGRSAKTVK